MNPNIKNKWPYYLMIFSICLCFILGIWWLYLLSKLSSIIQTYIPDEKSTHSIFMMILTEGATFFLLLIFALTTTLFLLRKEQRKFNSLQKFYAIFSHELKTPLTTLQLQVEILPDLLKTSPQDTNKINSILNRLQSSSLQLKHELEKMLTLSQLELGSTFDLESIDFSQFISYWIKQQQSQKIKLNFHQSKNCKTIIKANQNALETIFNNLWRNTIKHANNDLILDITLSNSNNDKLVILYQDYGSIQSINEHKLGSLFYKSSHSSGSGLGLFIIKQMMQQMGSTVVFETHNNQLSTKLIFNLEHHV